MRRDKRLFVGWQIPHFVYDDQPYLFYVFVQCLQRTHRGFLTIIFWY